MDRITCFVLKVASRCNLNCSYCYMYNLGDETYLNQPKFMSTDTITALATRLRTYCKTAAIRHVQIVFHGGEPLLLGKDYYANCLKIFKETAPEVYFSFIVQTNGVNLDRGWYEWFTANEVNIGISLDGPKKFHDSFRLFHNGKGSYQLVAAAVKMGKEFDLKGILSVININIPADEYYKEMKSLSVAGVNLLFPDGHYDRLPDAFDKTRFGDDDYTPFADWLLQLFKLWKADKKRPFIKFFENLIEMLMGSEDIGNQAFGTKKNAVAMIETDGSIEVADSIRACYEGITRNNLNVHTTEIEDVFNDDVFDVYYNAHQMVCEQCLNCPIYEFCGGGFLGSRFANKNGFDNPTIYCKDIIRIVSFLQNDLIDGLPAEVIIENNLEKISYQKIVEDLHASPAIRIKKVYQEKLNAFKQPDLLCS